MSKIYKNVGGNTFKLLNENVSLEQKPKAENLVREGLKKVFSVGDKEISYRRLQNVGMGYIVNVSDAAKCALREAQDLAGEYGYKDDSDSQKFVKKEDHDESNMSNPEESREVKIGNECGRIVNELISAGVFRNIDPKLKERVVQMQELLFELVGLHGQK